MEDRLEGVIHSPAATLRRPAWSRSLRRVSRSAVVVVGAVCAVLIVGIALFANAVAPYPPDEQNFDLIESPPSAKALFGTDRFGRDVLSRVIHGSRISSPCLHLLTIDCGGRGARLAAGFLGGAWDNVINDVPSFFRCRPRLLSVCIVRRCAARVTPVIAIAISTSLLARVLRAPVLASARNETSSHSRAGSRRGWVVRSARPAQRALALVLQGRRLSPPPHRGLLSYLVLVAHPPHPSWGKC